MDDRDSPGRGDAVLQGRGQVRERLITGIEIARGVGDTDDRTSTLRVNLGATHTQRDTTIEGDLVVASNPAVAP